MLEFHGCIDESVLETILGTGVDGAARTAHLPPFGGCPIQMLNVDPFENEVADRPLARADHRQECLLQHWCHHLRLDEVLAGARPSEDTPVDRLVPLLRFIQHLQRVL